MISSRSVVSPSVASSALLKSQRVIPGQFTSGQFTPGQFTPGQWPVRGAFVFLVAVSCLLSACGVRQIRDLPPLVRLSQIELHGELSTVQIRIENPNDIPFQADHLSFALELGEAEALFFDGAADVDIVPHSAEEVSLMLALPLAQREALRELRAQAGLAWAIEGKLPQLDAREWPFRSRGVIYPIPGRTDIFRASATGSAYPIRQSR